MIIVEIALGIVLAVLILRFLPEIFGLAILLFYLAVLLVAGALVIWGIYWLFSSNEGNELLISGLIALLVWGAGVLISEKSKVITVGGAAFMIVMTIFAGWFISVAVSNYKEMDSSIDGFSYLVVLFIIAMLLLLLPLGKFIRRVLMRKKEADREIKRREQLGYDK